MLSWLWGWLEMSTAKSSYPPPETEVTPRVYKQKGLLALGFLHLQLQCYPLLWHPVVASIERGDNPMFLASGQLGPGRPFQQGPVFARLGGWVKGHCLAIGVIQTVVDALLVGAETSCAVGSLLVTSAHIILTFPAC